MATMTPEMSTLKSRLKTTWESGDYGIFAKYLEKGALEFFRPAEYRAGYPTCSISRAAPGS